MTHDAEQLAAFLAEHSSKGTGEVSASRLTGNEAHAHLLVPIEALTAAAIGKELPIPLGDGAVLHVQKLQGGAFVSFTMKF